MEGSHRRITGAQADPEAEGENRDEGRSEGRAGARQPGVTNLDTGAGKDWVAWHAAYDEDTPLHHRLTDPRSDARPRITCREHCVAPATPRPHRRSGSSVRAAGRTVGPRSPVGIALVGPDPAVIWTRHRRPPDLTIDIRGWFAAAGFEPVTFDAPMAFEWSVGVHRFVGDPEPILPGHRLFTFVTAAPETGAPA